MILFEKSVFDEVFLFIVRLLIIFIPELTRCRITFSVSFCIFIGGKQGGIISPELF